MDTEKQSAMEFPFNKIYEYLLQKVINSKIIVIGGADDVCKSVYDMPMLFHNIIHLDSQIDIKPMTYRSKTK